MGDSFSKKELKKKKARKKQEKAEKMEARKTSNNKGKNLEDMLAYVDEFGNLSATAPGAISKKPTGENRTGPKGPGKEDSDRNNVRAGTVTFFSEKGFGFITDEASGENLFVHNSQLEFPLVKGDRVTFQKEQTAKGAQACHVKKQ